SPALYFLWRQETGKHISTSARAWASGGPYDTWMGFRCVGLCKQMTSALCVVAPLTNLTIFGMLALQAYPTNKLLTAALRPIIVAFLWEPRSLEQRSRDFARFPEGALASFDF